MKNTKPKFKIAVILTFLIMCIAPVSTMAGWHFNKLENGCHMYSETPVKVSSKSEVIARVRVSCDAKVDVRDDIVKITTEAHLTRSWRRPHSAEPGPFKDVRWKKSTKPVTRKGRTTTTTSLSVKCNNSTLHRYSTRARYTVHFQNGSKFNISDRNQGHPTYPTGSSRPLKCG